MENFMVVQNSHTVEARDKFKKTNKESWLRGIHPQLLCPYAKTKIKFVHYRKVVSLRRDKKKNMHHITAYIWLRPANCGAPPEFSSLNKMRILVGFLKNMHMIIKVYFVKVGMKTSDTPIRYA